MRLLGHVPLLLIARCWAKQCQDEGMVFVDWYCSPKSQWTCSYSSCFYRPQFKTAAATTCHPAKTDQRWWRQQLLPLLAQLLLNS